MNYRTTADIMARITQVKEDARCANWGTLEQWQERAAERLHSHPDVPAEVAEDMIQDAWSFADKDHYRWLATASIDDILERWLETA